MELRDQLQTALGSAYTIERELGAGGMSRVFVAREHALGRPVVVKVIAPELAGGVNVDRFRREIQLAAQLQHPHIVPVLSAGEADGYPYFTMPFVQGESLRARLTKNGAMPIPEVVRVLRDLAKALAFAHRNGVVHRDIKPENILLEDDTALVLDFGVAKALRDSALGSHSDGLTTLGMSLGTPGYMSPEQAAADPNVDGRTDVYAFGLVGYEMLTGHTPFAGRTPQQTLTATLTETPPPILPQRPDAPPRLAELVMRCLSKSPAGRPTATELVDALDAVGTGGTAAYPAAEPVSRVKTVAQYLAAAGLVLLAIWAATELIGLPHWVVPSLALAAALALPIVSRRGTWLTTQRLLWGSVAALAAFALVAGGYLVLRALGVGPAGNLVAAGLLKERPTVLVTDFKSPAGDSTLGPVVSEALRTDLDQSHTVSVVQQNVLSGALSRMQKPASSRIDLTLARDIAAREGIAAIVDGEVARVGSTYIVSARIYSTRSGDQLAAFRETAADSTKIVGAIDRLSRTLRRRAGESLKTVRDDAPLADVTTNSIEALRKYTEGVHASDREADGPKAIGLLNEAIALDSNFAMAYRKMGVLLNNMGTQNARAQQMLQKAYDLRDRLPDHERDLTVGTYFMSGPVYDPDKALAAYDHALTLDPHDYTALNNSATILIKQGQFARAEPYVDSLVASDSSAIYLGNRVVVKYELGKVSDAERDMRTMLRLYPRAPDPYIQWYELTTAQYQYDSAGRAIDAAMAALPNVPIVRMFGPALRSQLAMVHGKLRESLTLMRQSEAVATQLGDVSHALAFRLGEGQAAAWFLDDKARAVTLTDSVLATHTFDSLPATDRPYMDAAMTYAVAGRNDRARAVISSWERAVPASTRAYADRDKRTLLGILALNDKRYDDAISQFRGASIGECSPCALALVGHAFDKKGNTDSAVTYLQRYGQERAYFRINGDVFLRAVTLRRLGELFDARGDRQRAMSYYSQFVELWKDADPELQPQVQAVRKRMAELSQQQG